MPSAIRRLLSRELPAYLDLSRSSRMALASEDSLASPGPATPAPLRPSDAEFKPPSIKEALKYKLKNLPYVGQIAATAGPLVVEWLSYVDKKVPRIKGSPASKEVIGNLKPGITVALVSLPLSISLAIAAGATPVQGIITAAWSGMSAAVLGGSHYNIVGPTGALSGILSEFSVEYGPQVQPLLALLAGLICLLVWVLQLERYFVFVPGAVMHGFTLGVAFIIAFNQLNFALGLRGLKKHPEFLLNMKESLTHLEQANLFALLFFVVAFGLLFTLQRKYGKIPWSIVLSVVGIIIGYVQTAHEGVFAPYMRLITIQAQYGDLELTLFNPSVDMFPPGEHGGDDGPSPAVWAHLFKGSLAIAMVAVLETLISAFIADRMTKTLFNQRAEVMAVGVANLLTGVAGGIPATAALARTALNIKSGATSRGAGIVNGIFIVLLSTVLFPLFKYLPLPVVAAVLVNVAARMIEWPEIKLLLAMDKPMFAVALVSALVCIVEDPTMGIIVGAVLAMIRLLLQLRGAHATLTVYGAGVSCKLAYLFQDVSKRAVAEARALMTGEPPPPKNADSAGTALGAIASFLGLQALLADGPPEAAAAAPPATAGAATKAAGTPSATAPTLPGASPTSSSSSSSISGAPLVDPIPHPEVEDYPAPSLPGDAALPAVGVYTLHGYATYIAVQAHRDRLRALFKSSSESALPGVRLVALSLCEVYYADPDIIEAFGDIIGELRRDGVGVFLLGFHARVRAVILKAHWFEEVHSFHSYGALLGHLRRVAEAGGDFAAPPTGGGHHHGASGADGGGHGATAPSTPAPSSSSSSSSSLHHQHDAPSTPLPPSSSTYVYQAMLLSPSPTPKQRAAAPAETGRPEGGGGGLSKADILDDWK